jgi:uncharacterized protein (TIGR02271 family)
MFVSNVTQGEFLPVEDVTVHSDELAHYILGPADIAPSSEQPSTALPQDHRLAGQSTAMPAVAGRDDVMLRMPIHEEQLSVHKQPVVPGEIHVHKGVETQQQGIAVPVDHEEASIEHIPSDQGDGLSPTNPNETIIPILEERIVVKKASVVKEYLRIRKQLVAEQKAVVARYDGRSCRSVSSARMAPRPTLRCHATAKPTAPSRTWLAVPLQ